jgi:hypothetical protein
MDNALNFIRGIVRPVTTFSLVGAIVYLAVIGKIDPKDILGLGGIVLAFWFSDRKTKNNEQA